MNYTEIQKQQDIIIKEIESLKNDNCTPIPDGIIDIKKYVNSDLKILWINKEVNSENDSDGWSLIDVIADMKTRFVAKDGWSKTFSPLTYVVYGILNNLVWDDIPNTNHKPEIAEVLQNIAYINLKKLPGKEIAVNTELKLHLSKNEIVQKQIKLFAPDVIICGGTFDLADGILEEIYDGNYQKMKDKTENKMKFYYDDNLIIVDAYHPSRPPMKQQIYCDTIIENILKWKNAREI